MIGDFTKRIISIQRNKNGKSHMPGNVDYKNGKVGR